MKPLSRLLFALCLLAANLSCAAADDVSPRIWSYQYAFATSNDPRQFDPLLRHIKLEEELRENALLDYVAEALVSPVNRDIDSESLALLAHALSDLGGARYLTVFAKASHQTKWPTVRSIADKYVHRYHSTNEPQYTPGSIDLVALRAAYAAVALATTPSEAVAQRLASLPPGSSIDQLFALGGKPQVVVSGQTKATDGLLIHIKIQRLAFYYRGVGRVIFGYRKFEGWKSQGVVIDPEAFEGLMPYRNTASARPLLGDEALGLTQLLNNHLSAMKVAVEGRWRNGGASPQFLDTTAQVLLEQHASATLPSAVDVYSWMCRLLATYGGPRYANVLATVATETKDEKLRKFASLPMEKVASTNTAPFVKGNVSLAALRAQYPPLYPQRSMTSGSL